MYNITEQLCTFMFVVSSSVRERQLHEQLIQREKLLEDKTQEIKKLTAELLSKDNEFESRLRELQQDHDKTLNQLKRTLNENEERLQQELKCSKEINVHVQVSRLILYFHSSHCLVQA